MAMRRSLAKRVLRGSGLLELAHRRRNRRTLTVVAFHRVLDPDDPRWDEADPEWTISRSLFGECLDFFRRHYHVVGLADLLAARREDGRLPDRSLCITFDDGWADTAEHALPELERRRLPAAAFVTAGAVGRVEPLWREALESARRAGRLGPSTLGKLWDGAGGNGAVRPARADAQGLRELVALLERAEPELREELFDALPELRTRSGLPAMLAPEQVRDLEEAGVTIGSHGDTHEPLDLASDPEGELVRSRHALAFVLGHHPMAGPLALSFPHGRYRPDHLAIADRVGYQLLFTSDPHLVPLEDVGLPDLLGRISIDGREISGPDGRLAPELLALWLYFRPRGPASKR